MTKNKVFRNLTTPGKKVRKNCAVFIRTTEKKNSDNPTPKNNEYCGSVEKEMGADRAECNSNQRPLKK